MNRVIPITLYVVLLSYMLNLAIRVGWDYDPGLKAPILIVLGINLIMAVWNE